VDLRKNYHKSKIVKKHNPTTDKKLADIADVSEKTYRTGAKILNSDTEDVKKRVLSCQTSISAVIRNLCRYHCMSVEICRIERNNRKVEYGRMCFK
jgi:hypothetical protein